MKRASSNIYLFFVIQLFCACLEASPKLSIEDIHKGIELRQQQLESFQVNFHYDIFNDTAETNNPAMLDMHLVRAKEYNLKRFGIKKKVLEKSEHVITGEVTRVERYAWNGKKRTGYAEIPNKPELRRSGTVLLEQDHIFKSGYWQTPLEIEIFDLGCSLTDLLEKKHWTLTGTEMIGNCNAYLIETSELWNGNGKLQVWIDPTKDFAPVRIIFTVKTTENKNLIAEMCDVGLEKKDGLWAITSAKLFFENQIVGRKFATHFIANDYKIGVDLADETFNVEFPHGTLVYDAILEASYIVGEGRFISGSEGVFFDEFKPEFSESTKALELSTPSVKPDDNKEEVKSTKVSTKKIISKQPLKYKVWMTIALFFCLPLIFAILIRKQKRNAN